MNRKSKRIGYISPQKDHFVEGQMSIRSPLMQKTINQFSTYQLHQSSRLAEPKRINHSPSRASDLTFLKRSDKLVPHDVRELGGSALKQSAKASLLNQSQLQDAYVTSSSALK